MPVVNRIADFQAEMAGWRRDLHAHPETAFEEHRTAEADLKAATLRWVFGISIAQAATIIAILKLFPSVHP
jgi:metal-dependent amidase/aminoacylase/carboxypeptidase family protein